MKNYIYLIFFNLILFLYLEFFVNQINLLLIISVLFNLVNFALIFFDSKINSLNSIPKILNVLFNFSVLIFNYPDLLVSDPMLVYYGEEFFVIKAFRLIIFYQFSITVILKFFEIYNFGNVNLNKINFYNLTLLKPLLQINLLSFFIYIFSGNNLSSLFLGRASRLLGSFYKVTPFEGGFSTFFLIFNYFIQFNTVIGLLFIMNYFLNKLLKNKINLYEIKISIFYKTLISLISLLYIFTAFYSDVRANIFIILFPLLVLFFTMGQYEKKVNYKFTIQTLNTLKIIFLCFILFLTIVASEIQVYRRGNVNFFDRGKTEYGSSQGFIQTDKALYNLSEIIKLTPKNGTESGRIKFKNIPYQFIPSLLAPNKPTRVNQSIQQDVKNSVFNNFNFKITNTSIQITYLGEFIRGFGLNRGLIFAIFSTTFYFFLFTIILKKLINSIYFPYIIVNFMSLNFYIARSQFQYLQEFSAFIYSLLILWFYILIKNKFFKLK